MVPKCSKVLYLQCSHVLTTIGIQSVYNRYTISHSIFAKWDRSHSLKKAAPPVVVSQLRYPPRRSCTSMCKGKDRSLQMCTGTSFLTTICSDFVTFCYILLHFVTTFPYISHNFSINIINPAQVVPWWQIQIRNEHRTH